MFSPLNKFIRQRNSLRFQLTSIMLLIGIIPIIILGTLSYESTYKALNDHLRYNVDQNITKVNDVLNEYFNMLSAITNIASNMRGFQSIVDIETRDTFEKNVLTETPLRTETIHETQEIELLRAFFKQLNDDDDILNSYFTSTKRNMYGASFHYIYGHDDTFNPHEREWYAQAVANPNAVMWSRPYIDYITSKKIITLSRTILNQENELLGVFSLDITTEHLLKKIRSIELDYGGNLLLVDAQGHYMIHPNPDLIGKSVEDGRFLGKLLVGFSGEYETTELMYHYITNATTGWKVVFVFPKKSLYAEVNDIRNTTILISLIIFTVIFVLSIQVAKFATKPIEQIINHMDYIRKGVFDIKLPEKLLERTDDIGSLSESIHTMQIDVGKLFDRMRDMNENMYQTQKDLVYQLGEIAETRSQETGHHVRRVAGYSYIIGKHYGLNERACDTLKLASTLHDVGKLGIPDSILLKPGKLTKEEFESIKRHARIGYEMLKTSQQEILREAALIARYHHEKYDGTGYPEGISGTNIPLTARIVAIADVFDALCMDRIYKKAWGVDETLDYMRKQSGQQFDPELVDIFFDNIEEIMQVREKYRNDPMYLFSKNSTEAV